MNIELTAIARQELDDAVSWYEHELPELGQRFFSEVKQALVRISSYPEAFTVERNDIRKCLLHTFPYKILYSIEDNTILVITIAHTHRRPEYWIDRVYWNQNVIFEVFGFIQIMAIP